MDAPLRIGLVAGETSGDALGASLMEALRARLPEVQFVGLTGERMRAAGCESLGDAHELAVMGLVEPLRHLPRLLKLRRHLHDEFVRRRVDLFVGVDAPAFNLGLAHKLRQAGMPTVQYVSPQVWAWRKGRIPGIARAVDAVLCLLPFEPKAYAGQSVRAEFVGHPLADQVPLESQRASARATLGLAPEDRVIAVLPGSRHGEMQRLGEDFARTVVSLRQLHREPLQFIAPMASEPLARAFQSHLTAVGAEVRLLAGQADAALAAADVALVASGTATLQTLLHGVPMVVAYRLAPLTAFIARDLGLVKLQHFSLPNLLAGEELVPEFFQEDVRSEELARALHQSLVDAPRRELLQARFRDIHLQLRQGAGARAAQIIVELLNARGIRLSSAS
jgi:lipid-A-disaccharide synthase